PGTYDPKATKQNDYLIDREAQRRKESFSGVKGISAQDFSLQESMGEIADRTKERLGTSDAGIILARRRLLAAMETRNEVNLPGLSIEHQQVRSTSILLPKETPFQEGAKNALTMQAGEEFVSV